MNGNSDEEILKSTLYRYLTQELAEELLSLDDAKVGGEYKDFSILFTDIHNYTAWAESLEDEELIALLNEYFELMVEPIFQYKGTLDKYIGASIQAVFGSPLPLEAHAWCAVQTSLEMCHRLAELNASRFVQNQIPIRMGIGINSQRMFSGNVGSSKRMEFTAVGSGVNLASGLVRVTRLYDCDIIISDTTYRLCSEQIWSRKLGTIHIKGRKKAVSIYEVVGLRSEPISPHKQQLIELHNQGHEYYINRQFRQAMDKFATILEELEPKDKAAALHLERCCQYLIQGAPPEDWDGSWRLTERKERFV